MFVNMLANESANSITAAITSGGARAQPHSYTHHTHTHFWGQPAPPALADSPRSTPAVLGGPGVGGGGVRAGEARPGAAGATLSSGRF